MINQPIRTVTVSVVLKWTHIKCLPRKQLHTLVHTLSAGTRLKVLKYYPQPDSEDTDIYKASHRHKVCNSLLLPGVRARTGCVCVRACGFVFTHTRAVGNACTREKRLSAVDVIHGNPHHMIHSGDAQATHTHTHTRTKLSAATTEEHQNDQIYPLREQCSFKGALHSSE